jgi:hypothetical protein
MRSAFVLRLHSVLKVLIFFYLIIICIYLVYYLSSYLVYKDFFILLVAYIGYFYAKVILAI